MCRAHTKRRKACTWDSGSESGFLPEKCWDLQDKGILSFSWSYHISDSGCKSFSSSKFVNLSSIQISSILRLTIRIIQKSNKERIPKQWSAFNYKTFEPLKIFQILKCKTKNSKECGMNDPRVFHMYRKKADLNKPGEEQDHHKGAQPVSLLCIIRTCSLVVDRSGISLWSLSKTDLTNNFFVVFLDKEDQQLQSHAAAPVQIVF